MSVQEIQNQAAPYVPTMRTVLMHFSYWCLNAARVLAPYVFTVALALLVHPSAQAANSTAENMAQTFVQNSVDKGYAILKDPTLSVDERENHFRVLLPSLVDLKRVAAFTVGPYAHDASVVDTAGARQSRDHQRYGSCGRTGDSCAPLPLRRQQHKTFL